MTSVGVEGLGLIGAALTRRLIATGDPPWVYDVRPEPVEEAVAAGACAAGSSRELAERSDIVFVCVQTDAQCIEAVDGADGLLKGARAGTTIAVISTVSPQTIHALAAKAAERDVALVDTPLAGHGMYGVEEGSMQAFVGDDGTLVDRLEPTMRRFTSRVVPAGPLGSGAVLKLAHNILVYAGFAAMVEALELARASGVRDGLVEDVAGKSGALSDLSAFTVPFYKHLRDDPHDAGEDEALHIAAQLLAKDLSDAIALGALHQLDLPVSRLVSGMGDVIFRADD